MIEETVNNIERQIHSISDLLNKVLLPEVQWLKTQTQNKTHSKVDSDVEFEDACEVEIEEEEEKPTFLTKKEKRILARARAKEWGIAEWKRLARFNNNKKK